jgi:hypothetical protein
MNTKPCTLNISIEHGEIILKYPNMIIVHDLLEHILYLYENNLWRVFKSYERVHKQIVKKVESDVSKYVLAWMDLVYNRMSGG